MRKVLDVSIEKGMHDGQRITFSGQGDQGTNSIEKILLEFYLEKPLEIPF